MTFSGGGSRAAALAESVLRELAGTRYAAADGAHVLTEDVKLISSVSGGSVTAGWFGLHRNSSHPDGELEGLRENFLTRDNMKELELEAVDPITWFRLTFGGFSRIGALEALLDERLFHQATLAELNQPGKPYIVLNATDMPAARHLRWCLGASTMFAPVMTSCRSQPQSRPRRHFRYC